MICCTRLPVVLICILANIALSTAVTCGNGYAPSGSNCKNVITSTLLGGTGDEANNGEVSGDVDSYGNLFLGFDTTSPDISTANAFQSAVKGAADATVIKRNQDGVILWATYIGGSNQEFVEEVAVDAANDVYVCGFTFSSDFPTSSSSYAKTFPAPQGESAGFVAKFNGSTGAREWSSYYGSPSSFDHILACSVDFSTNQLITAGKRGILNSTSATNLVGAHVARWTKDGTSISWSATMGANDDAAFTHVEIASNGYIILSGYDLLPTVGSFTVTKTAAQTKPTGTGADAILTCLSSSGIVVWSTLLGGWGDDYAFSTDIFGTSVFVTGYSTSIDFPVATKNLTWATNLSGFIAQYSWATGAKLHTQFFASDVYPTSIAHDTKGNLYVAGRTTSPYSPNKALIQPPGGGFIFQVSDVSLGISSSIYLGSDGDYFEALVGGSVIYAVGFAQSSSFPCISSTGIKTSCFHGGNSDISLIHVL